MFSHQGENVSCIGNRISRNFEPCIPRCACESSFGINITSERRFNLNVICIVNYWYINLNEDMIVAAAIEN